MNRCKLLVDHGRIDTSNNRVVDFVGKSADNEGLYTQLLHNFDFKLFKGQFVKETASRAKGVCQFLR